MAKSTQKLSLRVPVDVPVTPITGKFPRETLAFAFPVRGGIYRAVVVDMATWGVHSVVEGKRADLAKEFAAKDGAAGLLFMKGTGPVSDIVVPVGPPRPPGGGGPRGWPSPLLLHIVEAVAKLGK